MSAWGAKPFENDLAVDYINHILQSHVYPVVVEDIARPTKGFAKHKLAYHYDRFRAACELMIVLGESQISNVAKGYYQLAISKLEASKMDHVWLNCWNGSTVKKRRNYQADVSRQIRALTELMKKADD